MGKQSNLTATMPAPESICALRLKSWAMIHEVSGFVVSERLRQLNTLLAKYSPTQPRVPAGDPAGGQWTSGSGGGSGGQLQGYNPKQATKILRQNAYKRSHGQCAKHVRIAIEAGGILLPHHPASAKDYDPYLGTQGFYKVEPTPTSDYAPRTGDIAVFQPYKSGNINGHIAMYDGTHWISDFEQQGFWPGNGYRINKARYAIYRHS